VSFPGFRSQIVNGPSPSAMLAGRGGMDESVVREGSLESTSASTGELDRPTSLIPGQVVLHPCCGCLHSPPPARQAEGNASRSSLLPEIGMWGHFFGPTPELSCRCIPQPHSESIWGVTPIHQARRQQDSRASDETVMTMRSVKREEGSGLPYVRGQVQLRVAVPTRRPPHLSPSLPRIQEHHCTLYC